MRIYISAALYLFPSGLFTFAYLNESPCYPITSQIKVALHPPRSFQRFSTVSLCTGPIKENLFLIPEVLFSTSDLLRMYFKEAKTAESRNSLVCESTKPANFLVESMRSLLTASDFPLKHESNFLSRAIQTEKPQISTRKAHCPDRSNPFGQLH